MKKKKTDNPSRLDEYPRDLQGPAQNKHGGLQNQRLRAFPGGTYGAANAGRSLSPEEIKAWEAAHGSPTKPSSKRRQFVPQKTTALQLSNVKWVNSQPYQFDVAICLHLPDTYRNAENGWSERSLQNKLRRFFNRLDSKVLKAAHRHGKKRVPRYIVLENNAGVGWHAHALLSSQTSKMSAKQLCMVVKLLWLDELGNPGTKGFQPRLAWAQPAKDRYAKYMTKSLYGPNASGVFDDMNTAFD